MWYFGTVSLQLYRHLVHCALRTQWTSPSPPQASCLLVEHLEGESIAVHSAMATLAGARLRARTWSTHLAAAACGAKAGHSVKREDPTRYSEKVVRHRAADPATEGSSPPEKMRALLLSLVAFAMAEEGRGGYWTTPLTLHHEPDGSSPPPPSPSPPPPTPTTPCQTEEDLFLIRCADDAQSLGCLRPSLRDEFKCLQMNANELSDQCILSMRELSECLLAPRLLTLTPLLPHHPFRHP